MSKRNLIIIVGIIVLGLASIWAMTSGDSAKDNTAHQESTQPAITQEVSTDENARIRTEAVNTRNPALCDDIKGGGEAQRPNGETVELTEEQNKERCFYEAENGLPYFAP